MKNKIKYPLVIVGAQWGDEGKGKVVDLLAKKADCVIRFNGGNNAGHSVVVNGEKFKLSLIPSGVMQGKIASFSRSCYRPQSTTRRDFLFEKRGIRVDLMIDPRVHIVMPYHKALDAATEAWKGKKQRVVFILALDIVYEDKNNRFGIRFEDLIEPKYLKKNSQCFFPEKEKQ